MKLTASDKVMLLQALWCKERELEKTIKLKEEIGSDQDILDGYKADLEHVKLLGEEFLNWWF